MSYIVDLRDAEVAINKLEELFVKQNKQIEEIWRQQHNWESSVMELAKQVDRLITLIENGGRIVLK